MNRETQRQIERLEKLADFISKNPNEYNQGIPNKCIIGLGARFERGRLAPRKYNGFGFWDVNRAIFTKKYGISKINTYHIFWGNFKEINPRATSISISSFLTDKEQESNRKKAVNILRYVAKQKSLGKSI